jgi:hypothetical protein
MLTENTRHVRYGLPSILLLVSISRIYVNILALSWFINPSLSFVMPEVP